MDENEKFIGFIANSYEFRSEAFQSPAVTVQNAVGPTPLRLLMLSQKPSLLGVPIKRYFSYFEPDADKSMSLFLEMFQSKVFPIIITMVMLSQSCGEIGSLKQETMVHCCYLSKGLLLKKKFLLKLLY